MVAVTQTSSISKQKSTTETLKNKDIEKSNGDQSKNESIKVNEDFEFSKIKPSYKNKKEKTVEEKEKTTTPKQDAKTDESPNVQTSIPEAQKLDEATINTENSKELINSLSNQNATFLIMGVQSANVASTEVLKSEHTNVEKELPEIDQPTGLQVGEPIKLGEHKSETTDLPSFITDYSKPKADFDIEYKAPALPFQYVPKIPEPKAVTNAPDADNTSDFVEGNVSSLNTSYDLDTSPGLKPTVELTGGADPKIAEDNSNSCNDFITSETERAKLDSGEYRGENDIRPTVQTSSLKPAWTAVEIPTRKAIPSEELLLSSEVKEAINTQAADTVIKESDAHIKKNNEEYDNYQSNKEAEISNTNTKIKDEEDKTLKEQTGAQIEAKSYIAEQRKEWQKESDKIQQDNRDSIDKRSTEDKEKIEGEIKHGDEEIIKEYTSAESEAKAKKTEAESKAKSKKDEASKKPKGFWSSIAGAIGDFFSKIRDAINFIFDELKKAVAEGIERAKKAAARVISAVTSFIVESIQDFGEFLKTVVSVALADYPALRDKILKKIDESVEYAVTKVNEYSEKLKAAVIELLDALGSMVIALLSAYQAIFNLVLDALEFLVGGLIKIAQFVGSLVMGAYYSGDYFMGSLAEEAVGGNPTEPLQNYEVPNGKEDVWRAAMGMTNVLSNENGESGDNGETLQTFAAKPILNDSDVAIDPFPAVVMDKELLAHFADMKAGEKMDFGEGKANPITANELVDNNSDKADLNSIGSLHTEKSNEKAEQGEPKSEPDWQAMSDDAKLDYYLTQLLGSAKEAGNSSISPERANPKSDEDESEAAMVMKTGRLDVGKRLSFMGSQMIVGIKVLWEKNKNAIIAAVVGALLGAGLVAFFTGGAGLLVAVQIVAEVLTLIFGAIAIARASGEIGNYVSHAWDLDDKKAGKSLANSKAILVSEFFLDKILVGMGKMFKKMLSAMKKAFKSTKIGAKIAAKTGSAVKSIKGSIKRITGKGGSAIKNSKLFIKAKGVVGKGLKKFDDFRNAVIKKFGFKKIWVEKAGKYLELWGEFNPKVLMMKQDGTFESKDLTAKQIAEIKTRRGDSRVVGEKLDDGGIVVSDRFADRFVKNNSKNTFDDLKKMDSEDIRRLSGTISERVSLRKDVVDKIWAKAEYDEKLGKFIDPNFKTPIAHLEPPDFFPPGHLHAGRRKPRADIGHVAGEEWKDRLKLHKEKGYTREQIIEAENNPKLYEIQDRSYNRSRITEQ
ncbi:MAG: hypothetical protein KA536_15905 [Saprospiraceae bacterium]|nr:hypothetical protein [Saprospiraceae bacterium]